ncbi:MAG: guanylate kinase [Candidatus Omnitrophota bacterium]
MARSKGRIFVVSAPSGCGKTSLVREITRKDRKVAHPPSFTTRDPRAGEKDGRDYNFISEKEFIRRQKSGDFLEWSKPYGRYYATSKRGIAGNTGKGKDVILSLDVRGALSVKKKFGDSTLIYILPPSMDALKKRLIGRSTDKSSEIRKRLGYAKKDIANLKKYDYAVVNDDFAEAVSKLRSIITAERLRVR